MALNNDRLKWYQTRGVAASIEENEAFRNDVFRAVERYLSGDWGEVPEEDKQANNSDIAAQCGRVVARYKTCIDDIYIITDGDFETTTILFCDEY